MKHEISEESKQTAIKLYRNGELTIVEISNLVDISTSVLYKIFRDCREKGILQPRQGTNEERRKFTEEQERHIAIDYYENDMSTNKLIAKWNIHPVQMQRIRNKYRNIYGIKKNAPSHLREKKSQ